MTNADFERTVPMEIRKLFWDYVRTHYIIEVNNEFEHNVNYDLFNIKLHYLQFKETSLKRLLIACKEYLLTQTTEKESIDFLNSL